MKTDQATCYDEAGNVIPCAGTDQDADKVRSPTLHENRFVVQDNVVYDTATGLVWCRQANPGIFPMTCSEAFLFIRKLNRSEHCGIKNWRLPSRKELYTLISYQHINPALPEGHPFMDVFPGYYWTASPCNRLSDQAWYIHLGGGRIYRGMKYGSYLVWPVAGFYEENPDLPNRFQVQHQTARDRITNLSWLIPRGEGQEPVKWEEAFWIINELKAYNVGGYTDWRLPNIRELESLIDLNQHSPALSRDHQFGQVEAGYWSSTTSAYETRYAWVLYPRDGAVGVGYKSLPEFWVWAVRRGWHAD